MRPPRILHCTSEPFRFFGREAELALLDESLRGGPASVVAFVGPGGQGKTAIVQHWLHQLPAQTVDGLFLWSFYRGKDADLCLRELYAYAESLDAAPDLSASYCVDHLLPILRRERWALVLDGIEIAQHERGDWYGRFVHPEMGRLLEELASAPLAGVVVLTSRFPVPTLENRKHIRRVSLATLDEASARGLLDSLGVHGSDDELDAAADSCGGHAKAVELLGTYLVRFAGGAAERQRALPMTALGDEASAEENHVARVLAAFQQALGSEERDLLALATAFRQPPTEDGLLAYLASPAVHQVLHHTWKRAYVPFNKRPEGWLAAQIQELVVVRLLERVGEGNRLVIDAHPLVRRGFENALGPEGGQHSARTRAGFLRGRPDRRPPESLEAAREEVELFHAYCDAGLWNEADGVFVALDNPKHRFLAPVFERELLLRFFPEGDWRRPPLWSGFGRYRSLAICFELLGQFDDALAVYRPQDAGLRGDALLALGRLQPLLEESHVLPPWQNLWQAYRAHALCLAGRMNEALSLALRLVPVDVYEWVHVFEALLRAGQLKALDLRSMLYRPPLATEHRWSTLARQRMKADSLRVTEPAAQLDREFTDLIEAYDRGGLPYERALTRLGHARWLAANGQNERASSVSRMTLELAERFTMPIVAADACALLGDKCGEERWRAVAEYRGPGRP